MSNHADPTPRSPADVLRAAEYHRVEAKPVGMSIILTVLHRGSETLWQTIYGVLHDKYPAEWYPVVARPRTIVEYVRVP